MTPEELVTGDPVDVARRLIGATLAFHGTGGRVAETEAYRPDDPASHSFRGPGRSNAAMFGRPGDIYVYRSYGIHWCLNIVTESGAAVLIRALEPTLGVEHMAERRGQGPIARLCAGPGRLAAAFGVTGELNGSSVLSAPFILVGAAQPAVVLSGPRIGITRAMDLPWRFGLAGSPSLSRPFPRP